MAEPYSMSFTTGALLYHESLIIAEQYAALGNWDSVRDKVIGDNLLQMRTLNAAKRIYREVASRLTRLTSDELDLLRTGSRQEQNYLLWLAVCKRYRFIYDFAVEILREKYLRLDFELSYQAYDTFFEDKAEWHPEVERVADSTRSKQRQVVFKMLREAELLSADNRILPAMVTPRLVAAIEADNPNHFTIFPLFAADVKK